jgi:hypothetical protein
LQILVEKASSMRVILLRRLGGKPVDSRALFFQGAIQFFRQYSDAVAICFPGEFTGNLLPFTSRLKVTNVDIWKL